MSTHVDHVEVAGGPRAINLGPAAAIGVALLVIGLAIGLTVGRLQSGSAEPAAANSVASVAPSAAKAPALSWKDDYATRHPIAAAKAPALSWKDDFGTRHPIVTAKIKVLDGRHRHLGELQ
ncbi:MAG TPA: hypothetical protein VJ140_16340 [Actinomycetota bacterium]|nr:hypothetical protein [Actinomycetota bacterium]